MLRRSKTPRGIKTPLPDPAFDRLFLSGWQCEPEGSRRGCNQENVTQILVRQECNPNRKTHEFISGGPVGLLQTNGKRAETTGKGHPRGRTTDGRRVPIETGPVSR